MKVYPIGYSATGAKKRIDELIKQNNVIIMDTRLKPWSWNQEWRQGQLEDRYGNTYHWCGKHLGNINYQGGPIKIAHPDVGIDGLIGYLRGGYDLILLCQCKELAEPEPVFEKCHVSEIVRLLLEKMPEVEVVRFEQAATEMIKAISVCQPYALWLANPQKFVAANLTPKRIENRNWNTNYRGPILIHASKTFEGDAIPGWLSRMPGIKRAVSLDPKDYPLGAIVGRAQLVDVITSLENAVAPNPWFCGEYGFKLARAEPIGPIPYRGALKLFDVPRSVLDQPRQAIPAAQRAKPKRSSLDEDVDELKELREIFIAERITICQRTGSGKGCTMTWTPGDRVTCHIPFRGDVHGVVRYTRMEGLTQYVQIRIAVYNPLGQTYIISDDKRWFDGYNLKPRGTIIPELGENE